jgi:hypothetical protein
MYSHDQLVLPRPDWLQPVPSDEYYSGVLTAEWSVVAHKAKEIIAAQLAT